MSGVDESRFDYDYVPEHLKERVENYRGLSSQERMELTRDTKGLVNASEVVVDKV